MTADPARPLAADAVVLVHGLAAHRLVMGTLARALSRSCRRVVNWGYPSLWSPIGRQAEKLAALLAEIEADHPGARIHLVGHSMGGIIARLALARRLPVRFGRLVMIAPPNRGSHVATRLAPYLGRICPPLTELTDDPGGFVCTLPPPPVDELGIIAASHDFLVPEASTRLGCERDYIVLPGLHSSLLWRRETAEQVRHFLECGRFRHTDGSV